MSPCYATVVRRAHELIARWPGLDTGGMRATLQDCFRMVPGSLGPELAANSASAAAAFARLWRRDPSAWCADAVVQQKIGNRLGWLDSPLLLTESLDRVRAFADTIKHGGFTDVVLLGMGGSSLAPEVLRAILGVVPGWPQLHVLDSTDPAAIQAATTPPATTLYLLASKSGTTIEPNSLAAYFRQCLRTAGVRKWAEHFVAITDEGTTLARRAREEGFRELFINPADVGGRYPALSFFGLVPAALMGHDVGALLAWGAAMLAVAGGASGDATMNPAVALGLAIGAGVRAGRDKLTLLLPPRIEPFGLWVEQLVAESTGKDGTGIIPITGERTAPPDQYQNDRLFVAMTGEAAGERTGDDVRLRELEAANAPVARIHLPQPAALGAEFHPVGDRDGGCRRVAARQPVR